MRTKRAFKPRACRPRLSLKNYLEQAKTGQAKTGRVIVAAVVLSMIGCNSATDTPETESAADSIVTVAFTEQRSGEVESGREKLLSADYVDCGIPLRVYRKLGLGASAPSLPGRSGPASELPYFTNLVVDENGVELAVNNCLTCHATVLDGEVIVGLGNEFLDFTEDRSRAVELAGLMVKGEKETRAWQKFADRVAAIAPYTTARTVGVNVANNLTFALMAHFDPETLVWSDTALLAPPDTDPLPVSVPPWWRRQKKHSMFYQGQLRGDHGRMMITAALLCADSFDDMKRADDYAPDIRAYIASLQPPDYPYSIDQLLAVEGRQLFEQNCLRCHGSYGENSSYPNLLIPLRVVGTDPALATQTRDDYQRYADWFNQSWFAERAEVVPFSGYSAPPLDGIWATAPFLHNGSVPTLELLLNSPLRPALWFNSPKKIFDEQEVGWTYVQVDRANLAVLSPEMRPLVYDTQHRGYGNGGHTFGDHLTPQERTAVIEYLKTL